MAKLNRDEWLVTLLLLVMLAGGMALHAYIAYGDVTCAIARCVKVK